MVEWVARNVPFTRYVLDSKVVFGAFILGLYGSSCMFVLGVFLSDTPWVEWVARAYHAFFRLVMVAGGLIAATVVVGLIVAGFKAIVAGFKAVIRKQ